MEEKMGGTYRNKERGNHNQDTLYEEKYVFNKKKNVACYTVIELYTNTVKKNL